MLYGSECWAVDKGIEQNMSVAEMRMLRNSIGVANWCWSIVDKMRKNRLKWFEHVVRREEIKAVE
jgi:hypothetical protein